MMKENKLDESASIYQQRNTTVTEKQKLQDMSMKEKLQYFNDYYKNRSIVVAIIIVTSISILYSITTPKSDTVLYAAIINDSLEEEAVNHLTTDFASLANIDLESNEIMIDSSYYISEDSTNISMASEQKLTTYIYAKDVDIIITDEKQFTNYANQGYFDNLSDHLPTDLYSDLSDSFYLANDAEGNSINAYGIFLDKSMVYQETGSIIEKPVIGIITNSKNKGHSVDFIRYLFGELK